MDNLHVFKFSFDNMICTCSTNLVCKYVRFMQVADLFMFVYGCRHVFLLTLLSSFHKQTIFTFKVYGVYILGHRPKIEKLSD